MAPLHRDIFAVRRLDGDEAVRPLQKQGVSQEQDLVTLYLVIRDWRSVTKFRPKTEPPGEELGMKEGKPLEAGHHSPGLIVQTT